MIQLVYITVPDKEIAETLAKGLVEAGLAAGVNISGPVTSIYSWQGAIHEAQEWQLFCQTDKSAFEHLQEYVLRNHPHAVPCILGWPMSSGNPPFLRWVKQNSQQ